MDYKNTLNLPRTDFSMKAELPKREPEFLKSWEEAGLYRLVRRKSTGRPKYILHDGPPYANGDIHIGHALNKTLKDIIIKFKTMQGFDSPYVPGWDCHGLPVEHQLFKELGKNKYQIDRVEFRKKAYDYALKYVSIQKEQFKRLGVFGDWQEPYLTLTPDYEQAILNAFSTLLKNGYIYRGLKPVNWCFKCETALAEAEVEYEEHSSPSIYVKFKLVSQLASGPVSQFNRQTGKWFDKLTIPRTIPSEVEGPANRQTDTYLVIWTTTPWTLLANVAVAAHPDLIYAHVKTDKGSLILAKDLMSKVLAQAGLDKYELIREFKGRDLENLSYSHPFILRKGRIVLADYVSKEEGSGLVHTAPGHGNEDYLTGIKYKLDIIMPVDTKGNFDSTAGEFNGLNVFDANKVIIEKLKNQDKLLFADKISHSYPHCWRCKTPIIFRATKQWFLNINHENLRDRLLKAIKEDIHWIPASGCVRISAMVEARPDWCLSRQRYWGVPIPALVCNNCHEEFLDAKVVDNFAAAVAKEGSDSWFKGEIKDFLTPDLKCPYCKQDDFSKGDDILDVWFDSGVSHQAVLKKRQDLGGVPCALYLEGSDQHRGWFQSSLIPSMCIDKSSPFKSVLTHGFVVDARGQKMSKSQGNVISPLDIIKDFGADILRLWAASSDYNEDIRISPEILSRLAESYRKIRNTVRFILSNLYDFNPDIHKVTYDGLRKIDKWALFRLEIMLDSVTKAYETFEFYKAYKGIYDFCNEELSMYYLDMIKGRLYTYAADSKERRSAQTAIYEILGVLLKTIAPILVFTAQEIWQYAPKEKTESSAFSVHLLDWPKENPVFAQHNLPKENNIDAELKVIIELIPEVTKALEDKRVQGIIGSSFDAQINILTKDEIRYKYLGSLKEYAFEVFKVSQIEVEKVDNFAAGLVISASFPDIAIAVFKAQGKKCSRCWNYSLTVGAAKEHELICERCLKVLGG